MLRAAKNEITSVNPMGCDLVISKTARDIISEIKRLQKAIEDIISESDVKAEEQIVALSQESSLAAEIRNELTRAETAVGKRMAAIMRKGVRHAYQRGKGYAARKIAEMRKEEGGSAVLDSRDRRIIKFLNDSNFSLVKSVSQRHIKEAMAILAAGVVDGVPRSEIVEQMRVRMKIPLRNAQMIVRTEIIRAANTAARKQYKNSGIDFWRWQTVRKRVSCCTGPDERLCDI
jgi:hypothetical protein